MSKPASKGKPLYRSPSPLSPVEVAELHMTAVSGEGIVPAILKEALESKSWGTSSIDNVFNRLPGLKEKVEEEYQKLNAAKGYEPPTSPNMNIYNERRLRQQAWVNIFFKEINGVKAVISEAITSAKMGVPPSSPNWVYDAFVVPYLERIDKSRLILEKDARDKGREELKDLFGGKKRRRAAKKTSKKRVVRRRRTTRKH
jgi:hypothetical protein